MKGKSQRNRGLFKALDGRKRGPPHGGWKNKDPKPKYVRGHENFAISKTGERILTDNAEQLQSKQPIMQLRPRTTCKQPQATATPSPENNTYRLLHMQGRHAKCSTRLSIYINKLARTALPTCSLISMPSNREGYAGKRL